MNQEVSNNSNNISKESKELNISHEQYIDRIVQSDPELFNEIKEEKERQEDYLQMIASENTTWPEVLAAQGSILTNKYAEGYPGRRYYGGCETVDKIEKLAIDRLKDLFKCEYANVQPHSGTSANIAVFLAFLKPGDTILGMSLECGGHLTHGSKVSSSGKLYNAVHYTLKEDYTLDYEAIRKQAQEVKPKIIIAGFSAYPRILDWKKFRDIADEVGAILLCDIAHIAGLISSGLIESPIPYADVVTSTTHKTLRGPRSGIIMSKETKYAKKINSAVFPGSQGGPLMHVIAAKAFAFKKANTEKFREYSSQVIKNAKVIAQTLVENEVDVITGGTDCHLILINLTKYNLSGVEACRYIERAGIVCNQNSIPFDKRGALETSGIRLGSPGVTSRGMKEKEVKQIALYIADIVKYCSENKEDETKINQKVESIRKETLKLCRQFPLYEEDIII